MMLDHEKILHILTFLSQHIFFLDKVLLTSDE